MQYPVEPFTPEERSQLAPHFTNLDRPVFALVNLPETVKGAMFARDSRYQGTALGCGAAPGGLLWAALPGALALCRRRQRARGRDPVAHQLLELAHLREAACWPTQDFPSAKTLAKASDTVMPDATTAPSASPTRMTTSDTAARCRPRSPWYQPMMSAAGMPARPQFRASW